MMRMRVVLTTLTLGSSLLSFVAYTVLLRSFGASASVDLLFYAASIPLALSGIASGVLLYLLPPRFTQSSLAGQEAAITLLAAAAAAPMLMTVVIVLGGLVMGRSPTLWLLVGLYAVIAWLTVLFTLLTCAAQARAAFLDTGIGAAIAALGLLLGTLCAVATKTAWLLAAGQFVGMLTAALWLGRRLELQLSLDFQATTTQGLQSLAPLRGHVLAIALGTMAFTLFLPIDAVLCSMLGSGALAVMSYAQRVLVALGTAVSLGAHAIAARTSADTYEAGGHAAVCSQANRECLRIGGFGLLVWFAYIAGGWQLLAALLGSDRMSTADLSRLIDCLGWMLLGVGPMAAVPYLFRVFYTLESYREPAIIGMSVPVFYGAMAWLLLPRFELLSLAYSYAVAWWLALIVTIFRLNRPTFGRTGRTAT